MSCCLTSRTSKLETRRVGQQEGQARSDDQGGTLRGYFTFSPSEACVDSKCPLLMLLKRATSDTTERHGHDAIHRSTDPTIGSLETVHYPGLGRSTTFDVTKKQ